MITDLIAMVRRYLNFKGLELREPHQIETAVINRRSRGRRIAANLPGIGKPITWLDGYTDQDVDY